MTFDGRRAHIKLEQRQNYQSYLQVTPGYAKEVPPTTDKFPAGSQRDLSVISARSRPDYVR